MSRSLERMEVTNGQVALAGESTWPRVGQANESGGRTRRADGEQTDRRAELVCVLLHRGSHTYVYTYMGVPLYRDTPV